MVLRCANFYFIYAEIRGIALETVIVIAAHPDDEILGCGGAISKHILDGDFVACVVMGTGIASRLHEVSTNAEGIRKLRESARNAHEILGTHDLRLLDNPDNRFDEVTLLDLVQQIEGINLKLQPTLVYTHHWSDVNVDHRIVCDAVAAASRSVPGQSINEVRHFEVLSSTNWSFSSGATQFKPNLFVDISKHVKEKIRALEAYGSEMREYPHSRSLEASEALAMFRGSTAGVARAEAFEVSRRIIR